MISLEGISDFLVAKRSSGLQQALKAPFIRENALVETLQDISFSLNEGEIFGYIGPNGAGKPMTIKIMSGILVPDTRPGDLFYTYIYRLIIQDPMDFLPMFAA